MVTFSTMIVYDDAMALCVGSAPATGGVLSVRASNFSNLIVLSASIS